MKPCSRCHGDNPRPTQRYCAPCHRVYMRGWREGQKLAEVEKYRALVRSIGERVSHVSRENMMEAAE